MEAKNENNKLTCIFCKSEYSRKNGARHRKSKCCKAYQGASKIISDLIFKEEDKIKCLDDIVKRAFTYPDGKIIYLNNKQIKFLENLK